MAYSVTIANNISLLNCVFNQNLKHLTCSTPFSLASFRFCTLSNRSQSLSDLEPVAGVCPRHFDGTKSGLSRKFEGFPLTKCRPQITVHLVGFHRDPSDVSRLQFHSYITWHGLAKYWHLQNWKVNKKISLFLLDFFTHLYP